MSKFLNYYITPIIIAVLIIIFSSIPGNQYPELEAGGYDYSNITNTIAHLIEFALLAFFTLRAFNQSKMTRGYKVLISLVLLVLFAITDEYHQAYAPGREVSFIDLLFDSLGILTGLGLYMRRENWRLK